ncbi:TY-Chap domain-containing protein [Nocardia sp. alder85J]|uniref:TY-Chap domain-containing protein n=1 Tax=Nocardia sp. alder85J TaxID=2862949 RepID=UPI001CD5A190|nr:hypothetical protein [Nocardia sp. alder85J]MCX4093055.1 hypothetical protein [Nocardia sp. alder85J]
MTDWETFAAGLVEELADLPSGALVVISDMSDADSTYFAQFAQLDDKLAAQLTGDANLTGGRPPAVDHRQRLIDVGWQTPDPTDSDNWWVELPWPVTSALYRQLATMVVIGLRDAFGVAEPAQLAYRAWNGNDRNRPIELPRLGLPRVDRT